MCYEFKRKAPERDGGYRFEGQSYLSRGVMADLQPVEAWHIMSDLRAAVEREGGLDYLQVYEAGDGRAVWVIDDVERWTMLMPYEY